MHRTVIAGIFTLFILASISLQPPASALDIAVPAMKARESGEYSPVTAWDMGYTGAGVNIAIIDSGVDDEHPDLRERYVAGVDFTLPDTPLTPRDGTFNPDDKSGHGTQVAGCAMAGDPLNRTDIMGPAPGAGLIDVKESARGVVGDVAATMLFNRSIEQAFDWCVEHRERYDITVISISLGAAPSDSDGSDPSSRAADRAVGAGICVVAAAGNDGPDNTGFYGIAAADDVITVGALEDRGTIDREDDRIAAWSSSGPRRDDGDDDPFDELKPDVVAPGGSIDTTRYSRNALPAGGYTVASGTSFAAPLVAGVVALMLEANPDLSPGEVKYILRATAEARGEPDRPDLPFPHDKWNRTYGCGMVDAAAAVQMAVEYGGGPAYIPAPVLSPVPSPDPDGDYTLRWTSVPGAGSYQLEESPSADFFGEYDRYDTDRTSLEFSDKDDGTYHYRVRALGDGGESMFSNVVTVLVDSSAAQELGRPAFLDVPVSPDDDGSYTLEWTEVDGASGYTLQESPDAAFRSGREIFGGDKTSFDVEGRDSGTYYYRVLAFNDTDEGGWSDHIQVEVELPPGELEAPAFDEVDSPDPDGEYGLSWSSVDGASKYSLEESPSSDFSRATQIYRGSRTHVTISGRDDGTYHYRVRALDGDREGPWSKTLKVRVELDEGGGGGTDGTGGDGADGTGDGGEDGGTGSDGDDVAGEDDGNGDANGGSLLPGFDPGLLLMAILMSLVAASLMAGLSGGGRSRR